MSPTEPEPTVGPGQDAGAGLGGAVRHAVGGPIRLVRRALPEPVRDGLRTVRRLVPTPVAGLLDRAAEVTGPGLDSTEPMTSPGTKPASPGPGRAARPAPPTEPVRLWVAPVNYAGQGHQWARAVQRHLDGVGARSMAVVGGLRFPVDYEVTRPQYRSLRWQRSQERYLYANYTHVLIEAQRPLFGTLYGRTCEREIPRLRRAGLQLAMICHGSDVRLPSRHAARFRYSPFADPAAPLTRTLERQVSRNLRILLDTGAPVFVSTPDLLDDVPAATWCPGVVDPELWASDRPVLQRQTPLVVHIPSNGPLKGTGLIDSVLRGLAQEGVIEYRCLRGLTHAQVRQAYQDADIVLDQFVLGLYGVAATEAMAAGRVVVAFVTDRVRRRVAQATGHDVPIVEADPASVGEVVRWLITERDEARRIAAQGPGFVRTVHDGRLSARVLSRMFDADTGG